MVDIEPVAELDGAFSSGTAAPTGWGEARRQLQAAEIFWLSTVRPDGRPHATPLLAVWLDDALHFCTGPTERKAKNLAANPHCVLTTGCNRLGEGLDVVVEGKAVRVTDEARLRRLAEAYESKYGSEWRFTVSDGAFHPAAEALPEGHPATALVYEVAPVVAFGFGRGGDYSQTRWRFPH